MEGIFGSGDDGLTDLLHGGRKPKDAPVVEALGAVDEAAAGIGLARAMLSNEARRGMLLECQKVLEHCMAELASPTGARPTKFDFSAATAELERPIVEMMQASPAGGSFVTPGDAPGEAALNLARAIVRRAERRVFAMEWGERPVYVQIAAYLNRLSDFLFALIVAERTGKA